MSVDLDRTGSFRAQIVEYGLQEASETASQSLGLNIKCQIEEMYNFETGEWIDWRSDDPVVCYGYVNIIKKDGAVNDKSVENLVKCTGWDGTLASINSGDWKPTPCQISTKEDTYKDKTSYKVNYINPHDSIPGGGMKKLDPAKATALQSKYGASLRAITANAKRNTAPPSDKPSAPPRATVPSTDESGKELPF